MFTQADQVIDQGHALTANDQPKDGPRWTKMDLNDSARGFWTRVDRQGREASPTSRKAPGSLTSPSFCRATEGIHPPLHRLVPPSAVRLRNPRLPAGALAPFYPSPVTHHSPFTIQPAWLFLERGMADSSLLGPPRTTSPPRMARDALTGCPAFGWGLRPIIQARRRNTRHQMRQGGDPFPWKSKLPGDDTVPQSRRSGNGLGYTKAGCFSSSSAAEPHYIISNPSHHPPFFPSLLLCFSASLLYAILLFNVQFIDLVARSSTLFALRDRSAHTPA